MIRRLQKLIRESFAPYCVIDSYGTEIYTWTKSDAFDWLNYCAADAVVLHRGFQ